MKRIILALGLLVILVRLPFSSVDQCLRPEDVMTTEIVYDLATDTYIRYRPINETCIPLYALDDNGIVYVREQWK